MLLAEALAERARLQRQLAEVQSRMSRSMRVVEGDEPEDDVQALLAEGRELTGGIARLVSAINRTNVQAEVEPGVCVADLIAEREALQSRRQFVQAAVDAARGGYRSRSREELRETAQLDAEAVRALRREVDALAQQWRSMDLRIQAANFTTELAL